MRKREVRNNMIKEQLVLGKSVQYQSSGWSLYPQIHSMDTCIYEAMCGDERLNQLPVHVDDVVFCEVQPGNRFYAHKVTRIEPPGPYTEKTYWIGNNKGLENGWCYMSHIYGKLEEVVYS